MILNFKKIIFIKIQKRKYENLQSSIFVAKKTAAEE